MPSPPPPRPPTHKIKTIKWGQDIIKEDSYLSQVVLQLWCRHLAGYNLAAVHGHTETTESGENITVVYVASTPMLTVTQELYSRSTDCRSLASRKFSQTVENISRQLSNWSKVFHKQSVIYSKSNQCYQQPSTVISSHMTSNQSDSSDSVT